MKNILASIPFNPNMGDESILPLFFALIGIGFIGAIVLYILPLFKKGKRESKDEADND